MLKEGRCEHLPYNFFCVFRTFRGSKIGVGDTSYISFCDYFSFFGKNGSAMYWGHSPGVF